ncbi:OmpA family protein [Aurantivibrio plasticivorans]
MLEARFGMMLSGILLASGAINVAAETPKTGVFVNPQVGYLIFDGKRNLDDSLVYGLGLGYQFDNPWAMELNYLVADPDSEISGASDVDYRQLRLDGLYTFNREQNLQPYLAIGIGHGDYEADFQDAKETLVNFGGGLKYYLTENLTIRSDARLFHSFDEESQDFTLSLGLNYLFGSVAQTSKRADSSVESAAIVERDSDKLDRDHDGVPDANDACPNTLAGVRVNGSGCALDSDNDGVADAIDQCPGSEAGAKVDDKGCYELLTEAKQIDLQVNFGNDSSEIDATFDTEISKVAEFMRSYPKSEVTIEGHTDDRGDAGYNQQLSERRAKAVAERLISQFSIDRDRVSAIGMGELVPIADNNTAEGRAKNRRVVGVVKATVEKRAK